MQKMLRNTIQGQIINERENEEARLKAIQDKEEARKKKEEEGEKPDDGASADDNKSGGGKTQRSIAAQSKGSIRETSQFTSDDYVPERNNIEEDFKGVLMALWKSTSTTYKNQMMKILGKQRVQRDNVQQHFFVVQVQFLNFLKRLDNKQQVLDKFVHDFNEFSD